jgi:folate-dependent phosphoribosylglycinamide formyltransferase PurN
MKQWIACSSQTGTEILNISKALNYFPDIFVTNNKLKNLNSGILNYYSNCENKTLIQIDVKIDSSVYDNIFSTANNPIITLNGWLKIVPPDICDKYTIYNGHPGLISQYPELKGKDPVERVWENREKYDKFGSVIHRVTAEVDEGKILLSDSKKLNVENFKELDTLQRSISLNLWIKFLKKRINKKYGYFI